MKKNQLTTTKSTALILDKSKSLMGITKKILEGKSKSLVKAKASQELTPHKDITIIGDLMWEKETQEEMDWDEAMEYAKNLRLGGYDNWRLPTREELEEVVTLCGGELTTFDDDDWAKKTDRNRENALYQEAYKAEGFRSNNYWSSTTSASYNTSAWVVRFNMGNWVGNYLKSSSSYVRCVRAGQ